MKAYLDEGLLKRAAEKNFEPLFSNETHQMHVQIIHAQCLEEVNSMMQVSTPPYSNILMTRPMKKVWKKILSLNRRLQDSMTLPSVVPTQAILTTYFSGACFVKEQEPPSPLEW